MTVAVTLTAVARSGSYEDGEVEGPWVGRLSIVFNIATLLIQSCGGSGSGG